MRHFDLCVIGSGSGNSIVDDRFSDQQVALVDKGERDAFVAHGAEEVRAHIESQHVYKHGKSETLGKLQHVLVDGESEMTRHDAHKEYESYAEGDSLDMNLAQGKT